MVYLSLLLIYVASLQCCGQARPQHALQHRSLAAMAPEVKRFQLAKQAYAARVAAVRKEYIAEVQQKKEQEEAKLRAETARIKEAKRQRLLVKAEERKKNLSTFLEAQKEQRQRFQRYLAAMQEVREAYVEEVRDKQKHLIDALSAESTLWITSENMDEKITDDLFDVAGRCTFTPTRRSRDWHFMALPRVPDFSAYSDEDLFDEKEDVHFLTEKSPWGHDEKSTINIPEEHEFYASGPAERVPRVVTDDDTMSSSTDGNIYFKDAAYRPSLIAAIFQGAYADFKPSQVPDKEVKLIRELAERYEEQLQTILHSSQDDVNAEARGTSKSPTSTIADRGGFDPKVFSKEIDG